MENNTPKISVLINTLNEEKNLPYALRSVKPWADEIVVVDMYSTDRTVEIARDFGARVYFFERTGYVEPARKFAVDKATNEWILVLDADELVPLPLSQKLREIALFDLADVVSIPWSNHLLGASLSGTGWGPTQDRHLRFFKRGVLGFSSKIHSRFVPQPEARLYKLPYSPGYAVVHFNYVDITHFIEKLNRYTTVEALEAFDKKRTISPSRALLITLLEFANRYFRRGGFRDGWRGFYLAGLMAAYRWIMYAKLTQLRNVGDRNQILELYKAEAERILADFELKDERKNVL